MNPIHVFIRGEGPDLVMVHGSGSNADGWMSVVAKLSRDHRLIVYDRRGSGRSGEIPAGGNSLSSHADDLLAVVQSHCRAAPIVLGASFGGAVALEASRRAPSVFSALVLSEPPIPAGDDDAPFPAPFHDELKRLAASADPKEASLYFLRHVLEPEEIARLPRRWLDWTLAMTPAILDDCQALMSHRFRSSQLAACTVPVLLVGGERSKPWFSRSLASLERRLPSARRHVFEGSGHMVHSDVAEEYADLVRELSERTRAGLVPPWPPRVLPPYSEGASG
ncbi:MAG: alpha/beta hydrolase [Myxococcales bacterium]|nr:alpha/beta hydrolase [Myxococcales bacterium]